MTFNYNYEYLIHLLYCFVHGVQPEEKPDNISFEAVFEIGKAHEVANIAFLEVSKLKTKPDAELFDRWQTTYFHSVQRDSRQWQEREAILGVLHGEGIRTLEAQGTITKKLYPTTDSRMMSDIDFIIDRGNLEKAQQLMSALGYKIENDKNIEFSAFNAHGMGIEFHTDFFTEYMFNKKERYYEALHGAFNFATPSADDGLTFVLDDTYYYLYSLLHIIKHFESAGCGIRRVLDLYYLKGFEDKIDMGVVNSVLEAGDFKESADLLFELEAFWFEGKSSQRDLSGVIESVITAGNHGNLEQFIQKSIEKEKKEGVRFARIKHFLNFIFPSKDYMYLGSEFCRKHRLPYPLCWLYRFFRTLGHIPKSIIKLKAIFK